MTIVVDQLIYKRPNGRKLYCHMFASSLEELHAFAELIGRPRHWFHNHGRYPHYDLDAEFRQKALDNDAQETKTHVYVDSMMRKYQFMETAPRDGTWINVVRPSDGKLFKCRWFPQGSSLKGGKLVPETGVWEAEVGGWFEPHEVMHWAPI